MYHKILVALNCSEADKALILHVQELAKIHHSHLLLVHVAEGLVARHYNELLLTDSEEMIKDRQYLDLIAEQLKGGGLEVSSLLALGNPPEEILMLAEKEHCDLIAMTSHGHSFLADLFLGSTITKVRHKSEIPLLIVKWQK